jgi:hypothetical protein
MTVRTRVEDMNSARSLPNSPKLKPPPLPKACGLSVVPPPAPLRDTEEDLEVTAVAEAPPEVLRVARSDVRELRATRPPPPRPSGMPRPVEAVVKAKSGPPPLPPPVAPPIADVGGKMPTATSTPAPAGTSTSVPAARAEAPSELELGALKPRPLVLARTAWFFGVFVTTGAFRWTVERFSRARAWLVAEWRHAAIRANPPG